MNNIEFNNIEAEYLKFCEKRKNLDPKTVNSYKIDLTQYDTFITQYHLKWIEKNSIEQYIDLLHCKYKPKSVKRKIASLKAFFHYLETEDIIRINPFHKIQIRYKDPFLLPKIIPINQINTIIQYAYNKHSQANTLFERKATLRNTLIIELLFATGMRIQLLGHSSITTTQIYTHTSIKKQKLILATKHPRNKFEIK